MADAQDKEELGTNLDRKSCDEEVSLLEDFYEDDESTIFPPPPENRRPKRDFKILCLPDFLEEYQPMIISISLAILDVLLPSFIPRWASAAKETVSIRKNTPTAYMDGLRGIATVVVYLTHFAVNWFPILLARYGAQASDVFILQMPIIRVFFSGRAAVATFFVVSGYALSYSALTKIHKGQRAEAFDTLSSSAFRRCMRLYLPCAADTLICALLAYYGMFRHDPLNWHAIPPSLPTLNAQLWDWWEQLKILIYPFIYVEGAPFSPRYNGHLWTIPFEVRGSWVTYGTVLISANLTPIWRLAFFVTWAIYLWVMGKWDLFLFASGILIASLDVARHNKSIITATIPSSQPMIEMSTHAPSTTAGPSPQSPWSSTTDLKPTSQTQILSHIYPLLLVIHTVWPYILFFLSMYLLSFEEVPWGVDLLLSWTPNTWENMHPANGLKPQAWRCIGAALLAYSISLSSSHPTSPSASPTTNILSALIERTRTFALQTLFTNSLSRYLGRISFGLYLVHGPVLFCLGTRFMGPAWAEWEAESDIGKYVRRFCWAAVWNTVVVVWAGDLFTRWVDERCVLFAGRVGEWVRER